MGDASTMRRRDHVVALQQRVVLRRRLLPPDVEAGAGQLSSLQCRQQVIFLVDAAAGGVHEVGGRLHHRKGAGVDHAERLRRARAVHSDEVAGRKHRFEIHPAPGAFFRRYERVVGDNLHAECLGDLRRARADLTYADHAQRLTQDIVTRHRAAVEHIGLAHAAVGLGDFLRQAEDQAESMLRHCFLVRAGLVDDSHACLCRGIHIDHVIARAGGGHRQQVRHPLQEFPVGQVGLLQFGARQALIAMHGEQFRFVRRIAILLLEMAQVDDLAIAQRVHGVAGHPGVENNQFGDIGGHDGGVLGLC